MLPCTNPIDGHSKDFSTGAAEYRQSLGEGILTQGSTDWLEIRLLLRGFAGDRRFSRYPLAPIFYLGRVKVEDLRDSIV